MAALADVVHFTDPGCPFAWNSEPMLLHMSWRYGDQLTWQTKMVGLAETADVYLEKGYTAEFITDSWSNFAANYPMPINAAPRARVGGTGPGCRAVAAAQVRSPERADALLRALRVRFFSGGFLDDPALIAAAATDASIDPVALTQWTTEDAVVAAYEQQLADARSPSPEALAQDARLADRPGGRRYTCPSLEVTRRGDGARLSAPGYQLWKSYELLFGNLLPHAEQRPDATSVSDVLEWAPHALATAEIAQIRGAERETAREELIACGANERPMGSDSFWTI